MIKYNNIEQIGTNIPPHSNDAEIAVLGAMMLDLTAVEKVIDILELNSMYSETHKIIYNAMVSMFNRKINIDIVTLSEELLKLNALESIGGTYYLSEINSKTPTSANIEHHAQIVQEKYLKRVLIKSSGIILSRCYDESSDVFDEIQEAENEIIGIVLS